MMKTRLSVPLIALASTSTLLVGCVDSDLAATGDGYAEGVYANYQQAAGEAIAFEVTPVQAGMLEDIADVPANDLLGVPDYWLRMDARGTDILAVHREARDLGQDEWQSPVDLRHFDELGWPVAEAEYRLLEVTTRHEETESIHQALEVCWQDSGRCLVMDPVVLQAEGFYRDRQRLLAEGWAPIEDVQKATGSCTLNSNPNYVGRSITYGAYWVEYLNVFGVVLVRKDMGGQKVGISCYVSGDQCRSSGYGYSNTSSCFANLGYSCDCDNTGNQIGTSSDGSSTKSWSESKCAHRALLSANVSWTIEGVGSGFNINWDTAGSVDSIGGQLYDACSWH